MTSQAFVRTSLHLLVVAVALSFTVGGTPLVCAQTFSVFHTFSGTDGSIPNGDLITDSAGNFYGSTRSGVGAALHGLIFKLDSAGNETVLYTFTGGTDGGSPYGRLLRTSDGSLYGMSNSGGDPQCQCGTVFKLNTDGTLTLLHTFVGGSDGAQNIGQPQGGLLRLGNKLWSSTYFGGNISCDPGLGCGTIFNLTATGQETVLYRFSGAADGAFPRELVADQAGNVYGVSESGYSSVSLNGAVFQLNGTGQPINIYNFHGGSDGSFPYWRLAVGGNGILYGNTLSGGTSGCSSGFCGILFSLDTNTGIETVLHRFTGQAGDGQQPSSALLKVGQKLLGTTYFGGTVNALCSLGCGVVYAQGTSGGYQVVHAFTGGADGSSPNGALIRDSAGNLYGATAVGGASNNGVIFKIGP